ncbi:diacylglycerol kinase 1-like protein, partial [Tanacetum coccineum]
MIGSTRILHLLAIQWTEAVDQPDEISFCSHYEEPCSASFIGGSPIWCCLWCQRLVHVDCHSSFYSDTGDVCDLGPFRRSIVSPLESEYMCFRYVNMFRKDGDHDRYKECTYDLGG